MKKSALTRSFKKKKNIKLNLIKEKAIYAENLTVMEITSNFENNGLNFD